MTTPASLQAKLESLQLGQASNSPLDKKELKRTLETFGQRDVERSAVSIRYAHLAGILLKRPSEDASAGSKRAEAVHSITEILNGWLSETSFSELATALAALTAVLEVDKASFDHILHQDGMEDRIMDAAEIVCADYKIVDPVEYTHAKACLAAFVSQAAAQSTALAKQLANPDGRNWLYSRFKDTREDTVVRTAAAVAFIKFLGVASPRSNATAGGAAGEGPSMLMPTMSDLLKIIKQACLTATDGESARKIVQLGLQGLGIATLKPSVRRLLAKDVAFLKQLLTLEPQFSQYSIAAILGNLTKYTREGSEDNKIKAGLKRYANQGSGSEENPETQQEMDERCLTLLQNGVMPVVVPMSKSSSEAVRRLGGQILLGLVEAVKHRGLVIQQGGAKALLEICLRSSITQGKDPVSSEDFFPVQALAKLLITSNPLLVLGPTPQSPLLIASLKILVAPITLPGSTMLQSFESLMALTNITSLSEELQERLAREPKFSDALDAIILESDSSSGGTMCRRAAVELLCNLASCETTFLRYTAIDKESELKEGQLPGPVGNRMRILLALTDSEDGPTREAALGAMATFTMAPTVALYIAAEETRFRRISLPLFSDADMEEGVQLRAIECLKNVGSSVASKRETILQLLQKISVASVNSSVQAAARMASADTR